MPGGGGAPVCRLVSSPEMPGFDFVLAGRYRLTAPLGEGGMAAVYRGRDLRLNREVAIKVLRDDLTRDPGFLQRFEREAQFVASLSHPNIVPVYDVGEDGTTRFIVMEYVRGRTLADLIQLDSQLPVDRAIGLLRPILDALGYAHQQGLVHRDVKPGNILVTPDGTPRLADFGIAHLAGGSATQTAAILGSAHYLSPEQSRGEEATPRSDIYACGIVLWEMLAGQPPFNGANALAVANQHLQSPPPPLASMMSDADPGLEEVIQHALAKLPEDRFEDTRAFSKALATITPEAQPTAIQPMIRRTSALPVPVIEPEAEAPPSITVTRRLRVRRSPRKSYLLGVILAALLIAAAYGANILSARYPLPSYPSTAYLLAPGAAVLLVFLFWFNARSWVYSLDGNAAIVQWGVLTHHRLAVPLHQIGSARLKQSPIERLLGVGTIELTGHDREGQEETLVMEDIPRPRAAYDDLLHILALAGRARRG